MIRILYDSELSIELRLVLFLAVVAALFFAIILHEVAHGYVALLNGDRTAKMYGRLSLNPLKHFDPMGFMFLLFAGFGFAKPVPINPYNFKKRRLGIFTVSIAGVATNIVLAFVAAAFLVILQKFGVGSGYGYLFGYGFFYYFVRFNLVLCFFNLLPLFPLDGFNVLSAILKPTNSFIKFMRIYSQYILLFLIGLSVAVSFVGLQSSWWKNLDILGLYLNFFAGGVQDGFMWFWRLIIGG